MFDVVVTTMLRHRRLLCSAIVAVGLAGSAHAAGADLLSQEMCKDVMPQVARAYAGVLDPVRRPGHCIAGDFNGDGKPDVIMVVKVLVAQLPAGAGVTTLYPFSEKASAKGRLQFLVLHSTARSAQDDLARYDKLLLDGNSPIMVLRHADMASDMKRVTPRSPEIKELQVPARSLRGEAVYLGTEAVSALLYWNGKTYVFHEDPAGP